MDNLLKDKIDLMITNYNTLKGNFRRDGSLIKHFGALVHANKDRKVDVEQLGAIRKFIKEETGWNSYFRGPSEFLLADLLCFEDNYKEFFSNMKAVHESMRKAGFKKSPQLPLASYTIVKEVTPHEWDSRIKRMDEFYKRMKENHFWLTSTDDYVFAAILAVTDLDLQSTSEKIEECYILLSGMGLHKGNELQTLSHILALSEEVAKVVCPRAVGLYNGLKNRKCKLEYSSFGILGVLTLVCQDEDKIINEITEVYDYIYNQNGYGFWSLDKSMRTILSATLVSNFYMDGLKSDVLQIALGNSIHAIIIAQQESSIEAGNSSTTSIDM